MPEETASLQELIATVIRNSGDEDVMLEVDIGGIIVGYLAPVFDSLGLSPVRWTMACEHANLLADRIMEYLRGEGG
jgi:hypothetical protein